MKEIESISLRIRVEKSVTKKIAISKAREAEIIYGGLFEKDILAAARRLKWVQCRFAGVDRFLFPEMLRSSVLLTDSSGVHQIQVSEHAMSLMLSWTRKLHVFMRNQIRGEWWRLEGTSVCDELSRKIVGIVGLGNIGAEIAKKVKAFDAKTLDLYHSRRIQLPQIDEMLPMEELPTLLRRSDFVVLALPLSTRTKGMFGEDEFRQMKRSAVLVNVERGGSCPRENVDQGSLRGLDCRRLIGCLRDRASSIRFSIMEDGERDNNSACGRHHTILRSESSLPLHGEHKKVPQRRTPKQHSRQNQSF
ncbi:MAG: hypothetical protein QG670_1167 [Thermoproteota archaeon]|nr:hypothetical protein [Thermoproteota archaeon]